jgi:hypothetical protein
LYLVFTKVTDAGLKELKELHGLRKLSLAGTRLVGEGLKELKDLKNLRELKLGQSTVIDAGMAGLEELKGLERLDLSMTLITDAGLKELKELQNLQELDGREDEFNCVLCLRMTPKGLDLVGDSDTGQTRKDTDLDRFINLWPTEASNAQTLAQVLNTNPLFLEVIGWKEKTAKNKLGLAQQAGRHPRLERHADDAQKNGSQVRFFRV